MSDQEYFVLEVEDVEHDTGKALLCVLDSDDVVCDALDDDRKVWIPQSQILDSSEVYQRGDSGELHVTLWLAKEKGWF